MNDQCTILIPSCDKYIDLYSPFYTLLHRYWPDCPFKTKWYSADNKLSWSQAQYNAFNSVQTPYVLRMCEDFFLQSKVDTTTVEALLFYLVYLKGNYMRLTPRPKPDSTFNCLPMFGSIDKGAPYRASLQAAIWKRETFLYLLEDEPLWQFEFTSSTKSNELDGFYSVYKPVLNYPLDVVVKGKWLRSAAVSYHKMKIGCDFTARPIMTRREAFKHYFTKYYNGTQHLIPWRWRRWLQSLL